MVPEIAENADVEALEYEMIVIEGQNLPLECAPGGSMPIPMAYLTASLSQRQQATLWRWSEARQLIIGNRSVAMLNGEPRGRYQLFADHGQPLNAYIRYECDAYRWVIANIHAEAAKLLEMFARLQAGEIPGVHFVGLGKYVANSDDVFIGIGAGIGAMKSLADHLEEKYLEHHAIMQNKEKRASAVSAAVRAHAALKGK
jgi:hypothetical protein